MSPVRLPTPSVCDNFTRTASLETHNSMSYIPPPATGRHQLRCSISRRPACTCPNNVSQRSIWVYSLHCLRQASTAWYKSCYACRRPVGLCKLMRSASCTRPSTQLCKPCSPWSCCSFRVFCRSLRNLLRRRSHLLLYRHKNSRLEGYIRLVNPVIPAADIVYRPKTVPSYLVGTESYRVQQRIHAKSSNIAYSQHL